MKLLGYDFYIEYKPGRENKAVDGLSRQQERIPNQLLKTTEKEVEQVVLSAIWTPIPQWLEEVKSAYQNSNQIQSLLKKWQAGQFTANWEYKNDILFYKRRIYLAADMELIPTILQEFHNGTHEGVLKTIKRFRAVFYWSKMHQDTIAFIRNCDICQRFKASTMLASGLLEPLPIPDKYERLFLWISSPVYLRV